MRWILLLGIFFNFQAVYASSELSTIRDDFHLAVMEHEEIPSFYKKMHTISCETPTLQAYRAVSEAMRAQVVWNPITKLNHVRTYNRQINQLVDDHPDNLEIRFLRLAIEYNLPSFLGLSNHLHEDMRMILSHQSTIPSLHISPSFGRYIFYFLAQTELCSERQLNTLSHSFY